MRARVTAHVRRGAAARRGSRGAVSCQTLRVRRFDEAPAAAAAAG